MRLKVLVDNNTYIDKYYLGEPAVSYYIEEEDKKILFDVGYSDVFLKNGRDMGIEFNHLDNLVISHGHNDHTGGLSHLLSEVSHADSPITFVAHPGIFDEKYAEGLKISPTVSKEDVQDVFHVRLTKEPYYLTSNLIYLGEIPRLNDFEAKNPVGKRVIASGFEDDYVADDSALVYQTKQGIYIITGCSHAGICNIIEYAKKITKEEVILGIIGGFHLFELNEQTKETFRYLKQNKVKALYPCHCTSFLVKAELQKEMKVNEVGVGLELEW